MIRTAKLPIPPFPAAPASYSQGNEQDFRRTVEQAFRMEPGRATASKKISHGKFIPTSSLVQWDAGASYLQPGAVAIATFIADAEIPTGSTIVRFRTHMYKEDVADSAILSMYRGANDDDLPTELGATDHTAAGWSTVETELATPEKVELKPIFVFLTLEPTTLAADARFQWIDIDYY